MQIEIPFNRGLNSRVDAWSANNGQCLTFADYQLQYGAIQPRGSMRVVNQSVIGGSNHALDGIYYWTDNSTAELQNGGNIYVVDATAGKLYRSVEYAPSSDGAVTFTDITNGQTIPSAPVSFDSLNGILIIAGGSAAPLKVTSSTATASLLGGSPPSGGLIKVVNNFAFLAGQIYTAGTPALFSNIYWSNVSDPETWNAGNFIPFRINDGDVVTALGELNGSLLVFKKYSIGILSTNTTVISGIVTLGPLTTLFKGVGCLAPKAVDNLPDGRCAFVGTDYNVYVTDGSTLTSLTDNAVGGPNLIDALASNAPVNSAFTSLKYFPLRDELIVSGFSLSNVGFMYAYDIKQQYWRQITGITPRSVCVVNATNNGGASPKATSAVLIGNLSGNIIDLARDNDLTPTDETASGVTAQISTSIQFPGNQINTDALCLTVIYSEVQDLGTTLLYGFDGSTPGNGQSLRSSKNRLDIKISMPSKRPSSFQVKFTGLGIAPGNIYRVFLDDEVEA